MIFRTVNKLERIINVDIKRLNDKKEKKERINEIKI